MPPAVDYGYLCQELEGLQEFGYKGAVDNWNALGTEEAPFLLNHLVGMSY